MKGKKNTWYKINRQVWKQFLDFVDKKVIVDVSKWKFTTRIFYSLFAGEKDSENIREKNPKKQKRRRV